MSGEIRKRRLPKCFLVTIDMKVRDNVDGTVWVRKGSMCLEQDNGSNQGEYLWVKVLDIKAILKLERKFLLEVTSDLGHLLEPVDPDERMKLIDNPGMLTQLATLPEGAPLWVQMGQQDELAEALLRYIGPVSASSTAVYFGVQLKGSAKGRGMSDGSYNGRQLFLCPENCALFVPVSRVRQRQWSRSNRNGSEVPPDPNEDRIRRHVSRRSHPHGNTHHSNGHAIQSSHHGNGHQEKPHKRFSLHQSQHSHKLSAQSILSRSTDPPIYSQTHVKGSSSSPFHVGQRVQVPINDTVRSGEVRWCGLLPGRSFAGTFVGVQLDDPAGQWNGYFNNYKLCTFSSPEYGALLPVKQVSAVSESKLNRLTASTQAFKSMLKNALPPVPKLSTSPTSAPPPPIISAPVPASTPAPAPVPVLRAALMPPNKTKPPPLPPPKPAHKPLPVVPPPKPNNLTNHTDTDQSAGNGIQSLLLSQDGPEEAGDSVEDGMQDSGHGRGLELGSMVEVNDPPVYGVIRWIGRISGVPEAVAGIELEEQELSAGTDGSYLGERYFYCPPSKGLFIKLRKCRRDSRFPEPETPINQVERCNSIAFADWGSERVEDHTPPLEGDEARELYQGWKRGIQGHLNSCYLDASLFSLFSCCSSADWVLFWPIDGEKDQSSSQAQDLLRCEIVNPLRRFGYVCASKTMALRRLLEAANSDTSFTNEEKDPEEFINKLFQLLKVEPLLKIRSMSQKPQECHLYQLFPPSLPSSPSSLPHDAPHSPIPLLSPAPGRMRVSSVQSLLESSFFHSGLKFVEAPSCLLLLMPRFGKDFKMYDAILPSLNIDITDLLDDTLRQCSICEAVAEWECLQCYDDPDITPGHLKQYCPTCNTQVHSHKKRLSHGPVQIGVPQESYSGPLHCTRQRMTLFAVTCIETSHYVSFVKHGPAPNDWLFFDSMADREGGENGFNVPRVKACPEVGRYLSLSEDDLGRVDPSSLKESTRRLLCDAHMCLYHSPELSLYK